MACVGCAVSDSYCCICHEHWTEWDLVCKGRHDTYSQDDVISAVAETVAAVCAVAGIPDQVVAECKTCSEKIWFLPTRSKGKYSRLKWVPINVTGGRHDCVGAS